MPVVVAGSAAPARTGKADTTDTDATRELLAEAEAAAGAEAAILRKLVLHCKTPQKYAKVCKSTKYKKSRIKYIQ